MHLALNMKLLNVIATIQSAQKLFINESHIAEDQGNPLPSDWLTQTETYFYSMNPEHLHNLGLKRNKRCLEAILYFRVTDEMLDTEAHALQQFTFGY